ncbi:hypothetical protein CDAR_250621 [Caerostris darwini]|uniref:Uncharacterized protein n=1 Tax=Caerostris darwini TaxID=1538125 RepID=A0AAV4RRM7_9ARAC|nr:hypothetical protein CDAR_250621 [Caerostris darwini]
MLHSLSQQKSLKLNAPPSPVLKHPPSAYSTPVTLFHDHPERVEKRGAGGVDACRRTLHWNTLHMFLFEVQRGLANGTCCFTTDSYLSESWNSSCKYWCSLIHHGYCFLPQTLIGWKGCQGGGWLGGQKC